MHFRLTGRDVAGAIAGSKEALIAVSEGREPIMVGANEFVRIAKELVAQPGTGRVYLYEWRTQREDPKYVFELAPGKVGKDWIRPYGAPYIASRPGAPPTTGPHGENHVPGALRNSIRAELIEETEHTVKVRVGAFIHYAQAMEFGSKHSGRVHTLPRPFMRPARQIARHAITDKMIASIRRRTKKVLGKKGRKRFPNL
jgi:hypothetical protein